MAKRETTGRPDPEPDDSGDLVEKARRALALKLSAPQPEHPPTRTSRKGMRPLPNEHAEPQGAIGAAGAKSAEEKGRAR
jgi:hypothetical protein